MTLFKSILISGGAGFIGSHVVRRMVNNYPKSQSININLDALTYASNIDLLYDCEIMPNYHFITENINDFEVGIQKTLNFNLKK